MGKVRIKQINKVEAQPPKKAKAAELKSEKSVLEPELAADEPDKTEKAKSLSYKKQRKHPRVVAGRSKAYQQTAKLIDKNQEYEIDKALKLLAKINRGQSLEAHLRVKNKGIKGKIKLSSGKELVYKTEKKQPLIHLKIGQLVDGEVSLLNDLRALTGQIGIGQIEEFYLKTSQSPSLKVKIA